MSFGADHRVGDGREACKPPLLRQHQDYQSPRWATAQIEDVDRPHAAASDDGGSLERGAPRVRIDLDSVGATGASLHDAGENIQFTVSTSREQIDEFIKALEEAREDGEDRWWGENGGDK